MKEKKRILTVLMVLLVMFSHTASITFADKETRNYLKGCVVSGCHHTRKGDSLYCSEHKCAIYDCKNRRASGDKYCSIHKGSKAGKTVVNGKTVKDTRSPSSAYRQSSKKSRAYDAYDEGYEDIWLDDDYDWDRYEYDDEYASGVDDAMEDEDW